VIINEWTHESAKGGVSELLFVPSAVVPRTAANDTIPVVGIATLCVVLCVLLDW
jgi:hypothetical protein